MRCERLKVGALLPHTYLFGGVRRYIELSAAFISKGHEFTIYTPDGEGPGWTEAAGGCRPISSIGRSTHDVLITGSPELLETMDGAEPKLKIFYIQLENVAREKEIVRRRDIVLMANSGGMLERVRNKYGVRVLDGSGGINPFLFHPMPDRKSHAGPLRVMCYGRLSRPRKGARFVIGAVFRMRRSGYDVELVLFDSLTPGSRDPRLGFDPGAPYKFYIDLPQERMSAMYASADVFVSAEHRAGWSNTCAEAAACGLPLICTRSGTEDFAEHGETAIVIGSRSASQIERALKKVYRDREGAISMGEKGAQRILDFTWDKVCDRIAAQFTRLLSEKGG